MAETEPSRPVREQRFERRMTDAEALMWNVEKDPWLNPSGGAISIHDRMIDVEHLRKQLAATVVAVPRLMEHVVGGVGRFSPPPVGVANEEAGDNAKLHHDETERAPNDRRLGGKYTGPARRLVHNLGIFRQLACR